MKNVLITGKSSYIGTSFIKWIKENEPSICVDTIDMRGNKWKEVSFSNYDVIFHVAGIAHADVGKVSEEQQELYYKVNTELTSDCAAKAKADGVKQFIFMSSIIVYGESAGIGKKRVITKDTPLSPANFYGDSKVKAEVALNNLANENFKVVILRPPMIYGKGSKGNYPLLAKMAKRLSIFPDVQNERSMLYVGNLCKLIALLIENEESGIFFPQNREYVRTSCMVRQIAGVYNRRIHLTKIFNPLLKLLGTIGKRTGSIVNKAFGSLVYDADMSRYTSEYQIYSLEESIKLTEGNE